MKKPSPSVAPASLPAGLRRYLYLTAASTGAAIMIVEILGAKLLTPYVGTSHFVWTAQIAVTLVALAGGYAAGGWWVDRQPRLGWLYACVLGAAVYLCLTVLIHERVAYACLRFKLALGTLLASSVLFLIPLALLAIVGPFCVRLLTVSVADVGGTMGRLTAVSTLGSVVGTLLISYVLIPLCPNSVTMVGTAGFLILVVAGYFLGWQRKHLAPAGAVAVVAGGLGFVGVVQPSALDARGLTTLFRGNSNFGLLQVLETQVSHRRYYLNDFLTQNTYDPASKRSGSLFTYMLHDLARAYTPGITNVLCIGVGVGIVPMRFAHDGARVDAVEINPAVVSVAQRFFDFQPDRLRLFLGDGRYFAAQATDQYDAIVLDAFLGESPPSHLLTRECMVALRRRLKPQGVLVMNTFGSFEPGRDFFCASVNKTLQQVFPSVRIHAAGNGNVFFVAAAQAELRVYHPPEFASLPSDISGMAEMAWEGIMQTDPTHGRVLTDDYNPLDFYDAANREELRKQLALSYRPE